MRVTHQVTLLAPDGAFGGPLRVALNQVGELRRRGHDVELAAGWVGRGRPPDEVDGVPVHAFPAHRVVPGAGFSGLYSPGLRSWLRHRLPDTDVLHVHAGRDLISLVGLHQAVRASCPTVVQTHGMIGPDRRVRARVLDRLAVRRLVGSAQVHLVLTDEERRDLSVVLDRPLPGLHRLRNGVVVPPTPAEVTTGRRDVLYCARLHPRKRPAAFVEMARLVARTDDATFSMVGPDGGELDALRGLGAFEGSAPTVRYEGALPYDRILDRMRESAVYVLPSFDEPWGMTLLEAMSLGIACVCTDGCGISAELRETGAAVVTDGSAESMAAAVSELLRDPERRDALGRRARSVVQRLYSITHVVDRLEEIYSSVVGTAAPLREGRP